MGTNDHSTNADTFRGFVRDAEPKLRQAYLGAVGVDRMPDAVSEALLYAWDNWERVSSMANPVGYLFRVGQSKTRSRRQPIICQRPVELPEVEPGLYDALLKLPAQQRTVVWLVFGCRWSHREVAVALDIATSTVSTHVNRGLTRLRAELGVPTDV